MVPRDVSPTSPHLLAARRLRPNVPPSAWWVVAIRLALACVTLFLVLLPLAESRAVAVSGVTLVSGVQSGAVDEVVTDGDDRVLWHEGYLKVTSPFSLALALDARPEGSSAASERDPLERLRSLAPQGLLVREERGRDWVRSQYEGLSQLVACLALLLVVVGPVPWLANRWGWCWIVFLQWGEVAPVGLLLFLLLSGPLPGRRGPVAERRASGGEGFLSALGLALCLALVDVALEALERFVV